MFSRHEGLLPFITNTITLYFHYPEKLLILVWSSLHAPIPSLVRQRVWLKHRELNKGQRAGLDWWNSRTRREIWRCPRQGWIRFSGRFLIHPSQDSSSGLPQDQTPQPAAKTKIFHPEPAWTPLSCCQSLLKTPMHLKGTSFLLQRVMSGVTTPGLTPKNPRKTPKFSRGPNGRRICPRMERWTIPSSEAGWEKQWADVEGLCGEHRTPK